jgi:hypothetical protein
MQQPESIRANNNVRFSGHTDSLKYSSWIFQNIQETKTSLGVVKIPELTGAMREQKENKRQSEAATIRVASFARRDPSGTARIDSEYGKGGCRKEKPLGFFLRMFE